MSTSNQREVVLVSMPWAPPHEPSLALGILKASLHRAGINARVFHFAPYLLQWMTKETYQFVSESWAINEYLFTGELDDAFDDAQEERLVERLAQHAKTKRHNRYTELPQLVELVTTLRNVIVPKYLDDCAQRIQAESPRVVGFTCLFDQTLASVALAQRLKRHSPLTRVLLGGYALQGEPGETVAAAFPWLDGIVMGDGEEILVDLVKSKSAFSNIGNALTGPLDTPENSNANEATLTTKTPAAKATAPIIRARPFNVASSPAPDYGDWFEDVAALAEKHNVQIRTRVLPVEASRGCWWGQVKHCVFCGIDDETLKYRYKPAEITLAMLREMRTRYGDHVFRFSDYIMPKAYYTELLPRLAVEQPRFRLQSEIKANQTPERVALLANAGFLEVQPGIESFSTPVLKIMDKGVRAIDNVALLKAGYCNQLVVDYNILYGLPGETSEMYDEMLENLPRLYHLTPPVSRNETVVTRFAPLQVDPERFGVTTTPVHHPCYDVLFSRSFLQRSGFSLDSYAYCFDRNFQYLPALAIAYSQLSMQVDHWKQELRSRFVELSYVVEGAHIRVTDSRFGSTSTYDLSPEASAVYLRCDERPIKIDAIRYQLPESVLDAGLRELDVHRLIWREADRDVFGLAVRAEITARHRASKWPKTWMCLFS